MCTAETERHMGWVFSSHPRSGSGCSCFVCVLNGARTPRGIGCFLSRPMCSFICSSAGMSSAAIVHAFAFARSKLHRHAIKHIVAASDLATHIMISQACVTYATRNRTIMVPVFLPLRTASRKCRSLTDLFGIPNEFRHQRSPPWELASSTSDSCIR